MQLLRLKIPGLELELHTAFPATSVSAFDRADTAITFDPPAVATHAPVRVGAPNDFVALDENGDIVPTGGSHVAVFDRSTDLEWLVAYVGGRRLKPDEAAPLTAAIDVLGGGWRVPTRPELLSIVELTKYDPCIDTNYFPGTKSEWHLTSSPAPWSPADVVLVVYFDGGYCGAYGRGDGGWVRAVRSRGRSPGQ